MLSAPRRRRPADEERERSLVRRHEQRTGTGGVAAEDRVGEALGDVALHGYRGRMHRRRATAAGEDEREQHAAEQAALRAEEIVRDSHAHEAYETQRMITAL